MQLEVHLAQVLPLLLLPQRPVVKYIHHVVEVVEEVYELLFELFPLR